MNGLQVTALDRGLLAGVHGEAGGRVRVDLAVLPVWTDERPLQGFTGYMDWRMSGRLSDLIRTRFCDGEKGQSVLLPGERRLPADRLVLVGLGPSEGFDDERARHAGRRIVTVAGALRPRDVLLALPVSSAERGPIETLVREVAGEVPQLAHDGPDPATWWMVADPGQVGRLRALLEGPPRAAEEV